MNTLYGRITHLTASGNMTLVDVDVKGTHMTAVVLGLPEKVGYLKISNHVELMFNESEVSIGKLVQGQMSLNNQLDCVIDNLVIGEIFSQVMLSFKGCHMTSMITSRSVRRLGLIVGDRVTAFIKTNEVTLKEPDESGSGD